MKAHPTAQCVARDYLGRLQAALDAVAVDTVAEISHRLYAAYRGGRKVLIIGNGGSASTASHMACDLSKNVFGQCLGEASRKGRFKVLALADNMPSLTAWANDTHYDRVFLEQVRTFTDPGDVVIAISGSGHSPNVVEAVQLATKLGAETIGLLGFKGGTLKNLVDVAIVVESDDYGPVEDIHLTLTHILTASLREMIAAETNGLPEGSRETR